ncbi:predicted protein [Nematostella vectensis]|uniref:Uncharacterized protein n=1 Tax=Nematostella vectensis TaxID=45351 RepID=A7SZ29_NEMVE|nr:predicted protein [Nematostella vectensis]|eukprot:XP_001623136.1 predicted protein [Nematostella vectensis]
MRGCFCQAFQYTYIRELRTDETCFDVHESFPGAKVHFFPCHEMKGNQEFLFTEACVFLFLLVPCVCSVELKTTPKECPNITKTNEVEGKFHSPGGAGGYPNNSDCLWQIQASLAATVQIIFEDFDLELSKTCFHYDSVKVTQNCGGSWVDVDQDAYCGNRTRFNVTSSCGWVRIRFKSDESITGRGFNATYRIIRDRKPPVITCLGPDCNKTQHEIAESDVRLDCVAEGYPLPIVEWSRVGGVMPNYRQLSNGSVVLKQVKMTDTGVYQCQANNSQGGDIDRLSLHVAEKCTCPKRILTNWYELPPYTRTDAARKENSLFRVLIRTIFQTCCGNCTGGHGPSEIIFDGANSTKMSFIETRKEENLNQKDTISFPIPGNADDTTYQNTLRFLPLVTSPGIAFVVVNDEPGTSANAVFTSVLGGWPVLVLTLIMALLSGMIMWALCLGIDRECRGIDRECRGIDRECLCIDRECRGIDRECRSIDRECRCIDVVAIQNSTEYRLGIQKNAQMKAELTLDAMAQHLKARKSKGALVDTYVAAEVPTFTEAFKNQEFRVSQMLDHSSNYGIVFGDENGPLSEDSFQKCVHDYVLVNKAEISKKVESRVEALDKPKESAAVEKSSGLFDASSPLFTNAVYSSLGMLLFLAACGITWDYGYMRHWRKKSELEELEMLGGPGYEVAKRNMDMMDAMMREVQEFYDNWNRRLDEITVRHDEEQKVLAKHHK